MKKFIIGLIIIFLFGYNNMPVYSAETDNQTVQQEEQTKNVPDDINPSEDTVITPEEESIIHDENNPIEYDASSENIKDKNFTPKVKSEEPEKKVKKEKVKKDKKNKNENENETEKPVQETTNNTDEQIEENAQSVEYQEPVKQKVYSQDDYEQMYRDMPVPTHTYMHGVDPDQYYDMKDAMWSPYPLLRLNSPIYFKNITVERGYYLLTPREYKGDWYVLFKEAGKVKYIIPTFSKDFVDEFYYRDHLKELDMTKSQRWQIKFLNAWGKYIKRSKRKPAIKTNLELTDLDNNFLLIELYYGYHKYSMIFRVEKY